MKMWAVRGATTITADDPGLISMATKELLSELIKGNQIEIEQIVSIIFTVTPDIKSEFPAVGARELGLQEIPLLCAQEISKLEALPYCIRVLVQFYTEFSKAELRPVYLHEAVKLRPDLFELKSNL